ncbi:IS200/IS605 family transposase [Siphonobacter aquaeclarae]|uniref:REP element-mobilizing transposase RayT n=1 Tax=Siphonobacter aquaeclarae TaxID=563176 RepID=A0A1G9MRZ7_9BACT|nr:IS200/IS605 family transposase [Siphonobacter aquaeclarae]SDL76883.1 REP element-mobilizing transposase RayT [Siphonobacter aquaeclarae]
MGTYTQILYQIVFSTKYRHQTLSGNGRPKLFQYMSGVLRNQRCHPYIINGVEDHVHLVTHLHPSVALADLVKDVKLASSAFIRETGLFPEFDYWQVGYGAFTYSQSAKEDLIRYVADQERHHGVVSFPEEYRGLLEEHGVAFEERFLW